MRNWIPAEAWILLVLAVLAFAPGKYVIEHIAHDPRRRDITQPPEDLEWRTTRKFVRSLIWLLVCIGLAVFVFTPQAQEFARSAYFVPSVMFTIGMAALSASYRGYRTGIVTPLIRGASEYSREEQPRRYWASMAWNILFGSFLLVISPLSVGSEFQRRCEAVNSEDNAPDALAACNHALEGETDPDDRADILKYRGQAYYWLDDYQRSLADYSQVLSRDPDDSYTLYNRSLVYEKLGEPLKALADVTRSLKLRPDNYNGLIESADLRARTEDLDGAVEALTKAIALEPGNTTAIAYRAKLYHDLGKADLAEADLATLQELAPVQNHDGRVDVVLAMQKEDYGAIVDLTTRMLSVDPDDEWALRKRADAYWELGQESRAQDDDDRRMALEEVRDLLIEIHCDCEKGAEPCGSFFIPRSQANNKFRPSPIC